MKYNPKRKVQTYWVGNLCGYWFRNEIWSKQARAGSSSQTGRMPMHKCLREVHKLLKLVQPGDTVYIANRTFEWFIVK